MRRRVTEGEHEKFMMEIAVGEADLSAAMKRAVRGKMPAQRPGKSKQDYGTPTNFIEAVERRFGKIGVDLAATAQNAKAKVWISPEQDSLRVNWRQWKDENCWLNPPFADIAPWAERCAEMGAEFRRGYIFFLTPASVGANWFEKHVFGKAYVLGLVGRLTFEGETQPYPKDCILSVFGRLGPGFDLWRWR